MKNKLYYLTKNILLFAINSFVPKLLSFILVPIYTGILTTGEYGVADLIVTTVTLLIPVFTLDIQDAVMFYAIDKTYDNDDVFSNALKIIFGGTIFVALGSFIASKLNIPGLENYYLIFFVIRYLTTALHNSVTMFCRGIDKVKIIMQEGIINSVITFSANILFLVGFKWGLAGYLLANSIGTVVSLLYCFFVAKLYKYIKWSTDYSVCREMIKYSFPLIFGAIAWWVNHASDRYILTWMAGISASGLYAVAYKIPNLLSILQTIFSKAWSISVIKEFNKDDSDGFISNMYNLMNFMGVTVCSALMILNVPVAKYLYSNEFYEVWKYVPPLLISVVFNSMALFVDGIFTAVKDTKTISICTITGAVVNTIGNFVLIYYFGVYGAGVATLIGFAATFIIRHVIVRKHIRLKIKWVRDISIYLLLIVQMIAGIFGMKYIYAQLVILLFILILYHDEFAGIIKKLKTIVFKHLR